MTCRLLVYPEMVWAVTYVFIILYKLTSVILETWHFNEKPLKCRPLLSTRCFCMACLPLRSKTCIKSTKFWSWKTVMMHYFDCLCRNALLMQTERKKGSFFFGGWSLALCMKEAGCGSGVIQLWGWFDVLPASEMTLASANWSEMIVQLMGGRSGGHSCSQHPHSMLPGSLCAHCVVQLKRHILKGPFIVNGSKHICRINISI